MKYLFVFTIGPVQAFVENSRKFRDMYAGSKLLSETMNEAILWLGQRQNFTGNVEVVFPITTDKIDEKKTADTIDAPRKQQSFSIPNRLIAKVSSHEEEEEIRENSLLKLGNDLTEYIRNQFMEKCIGILENCEIEGKGIELARHQLSSFLEIYWAYEKYEGDSQYAQTYQQLFSTINEVKGIRIFSQTEEAWGRKCSLFPEYNAIYAKKTLNESTKKSHFPYMTNAKYVYDISDNRKLQFAVKPNEALSAIALVKRMYDRKDIELHSIRLMMLKSRVTDERFGTLNITPCDELSNALYDLANDNPPTTVEYEAKIIEDAQRLYEQIQKEGIKLSSYYALIKFDGDSMGEAFKQRQTEKEQRELSEAIGKFADKAPEILSQHKGLPVFAGGEDFFGVLPLDTLFDCLAELHKEFRSTIGLTFSCGVAIAHLMQPLKEVAAKAGEMEAMAKKAEGKNSFVLGVIKRSGETVHAPAYKMSCEEEQAIRRVPYLEDVSNFINLLKDSECSKSLIYNISNVFEILENGEKLPNPMAEGLLQNCINRAVMNEEKVKSSELIKILMLFYESQPKVRNFLDSLNVMSFISREVI